MGAGRPRDIRITSLDELVWGTCVAGEARAVRVEEPVVAAQSLVAVVEGDGLARLFGSVGATIVRARPHDSPSVTDLAEAIDRSPGMTVHLIPNDEAWASVAAAAAAGGSKRVELAAATTVPQGLAAALAFDPEVSPEQNARSMRAAADRCSAGAVALGGEGSADHGAAGDEWTGLCGGEIRVKRPDAGGVAAELVTRHLGAEGRELVTIYLGAGFSDDEGRRVAQAIEAAAPDLEIEVHRGDQSRYQLLVGLE